MIDISFRTTITSRTHCICCCQRTLATIYISFRASITSGTRFIENISVVLPARYCYDRFSLSSKYYEPHAFYRKHFWCFSTFRTKNIHILSVAASAFLLRSILIPFEFVTNRTLFIETITCVFPHLERRIYTYILSVAASALLLWSIFPFEQELRAARIASVAASALLLWSIFPFE